ncbi:hypothetical protein [Streptomyces sp. A5-4]|uniref:hypothetical protein n=1 Tax=Streptomyces sp. A5-4 TaxID=3384771 RepID=UPI003DA9F2FD
MTKNGEPVLEFWTKEQADTYKHKLNGVSTTVEGLKVAVGLLSVGFTPFKIDISMLKGDEKGIVFRGRQLVTWPWAAEDQERADKKLVKASAKADVADENAKQAIRNTRDIARQVATAGRGAPGATPGGMPPAVKTSLDHANRARTRADKAYKSALAAYQKTETVATKADQEKTRAAKAVTDAKTSFERVQTGIEQARTKLRQLESELAS